jgi:hypothetical protein
MSDFVMPWDVCIECGKTLDKSKMACIPGCTEDEEMAATAVRYYREVIDSDGEELMSDTRYWCGDCWRASILNMPDVES